MTETVSSAEADVPSSGTLSPRDEARVRFALFVNTLVAEVSRLMPVHPEEAPGDVLRAALALRESLDRVIESAVVSERESAATWEQIGSAAGLSRQAAHEKWARGVDTWAAMGRRLMLSNDKQTSLQLAQALDERYAKLWTLPKDAVSAGLDAVRFPGSDHNERDRRRQGLALHARREELLKQADRTRNDREVLDEKSGAGDFAASLDASAALNDQLADIYEQLVTAEPALAEEHKGSAERHRGWARANRDYSKGVNTNWGEGVEAP
jgi:hypothetical protein